MPNPCFLKKKEMSIYYLQYCSCLPVSICFPLFCRGRYSLCFYYRANAAKRLIFYMFSLSHYLPFGLFTLLYRPKVQH